MRTLGIEKVAAAFLAGAIVGGFVGSNASGPRSAEAAVTGPTQRATTTAGEQYRAWYTRPNQRSTATTSASQQYRDWYLRPSRTLAGSTTASQQYRDWYLRPSRTLGGSTTASQQYRDWYLRNSGGR